MTLATYRRKSLFGAYSLEAESTSYIMAGTMAVGRHGTGAVAECLHLNLQVRERETGNSMGF